MWCGGTEVRRLLLATATSGGHVTACLVSLPHFVCSLLARRTLPHYQKCVFGESTKHKTSRCPVKTPGPARLRAISGCFCRTATLLSNMKARKLLAWGGSVHVKYCLRVTDNTQTHVFLITGRAPRHKGRQRVCLWNVSGFAPMKLSHACICTLVLSGFETSMRLWIGLYCFLSGVVQAGKYLSLSGWLL